MVYRIKKRTKAQKYESCVKQVKKKDSKYNPYAVCRSSVYGVK